MRSRRDAAARARDVVRVRAPRARLELRGRDADARACSRARCWSRSRCGCSRACSPASTSRSSARMAPWMPFAVRLHLAVSLIGLLSLGVYLSPAMDLEADLAGILLGINMAVVAIGMATGWHTREAAWLLIALGPLGMIEFGVSPVLQRLDVLGLAVFVLCTGPGRWSADMELGRAREPSLDDQARAVWALRVGAGLALIVVAFAEKLANPELALAFLDDHPELNVARELGLGWSDLRVHPRGGRDRGAVRPAADLRRAAPGGRGDRRRAVQRVAVVLRRQRAARPPAGLRARCSCCWSTAPTASCAPASRRCGRGAARDHPGHEGPLDRRRRHPRSDPGARAGRDRAPDGAADGRAVRPDRRHLDGRHPRLRPDAPRPRRQRRCTPPTSWPSSTAPRGRRSSTARCARRSPRSAA